MNQLPDDIVSFQCYVQRAMVGRILPSMRAIMVDITSEMRNVLVVFDGPPGPEALELLSEAEAELLADYPDDKVVVQALAVPLPARIPQDRGVWVYGRYEPGSSG